MDRKSRRGTAFACAQGVEWEKIAFEGLLFFTSKAILQWNNMQ